MQSSFLCNSSPRTLPAAASDSLYWHDGCNEQDWAAVMTFARLHAIFSWAGGTGPLPDPGERHRPIAKTRLVVE